MRTWVYQAEKGPALLSQAHKTSLQQALKVPGKCAPVPMHIFTNPRTSYRENLGMFVEYKACSIDKKARVVEVGVDQGLFAEVIAERW